MSAFATTNSRSVSELIHALRSQLGPEKYSPKKGRRAIVAAGLKLSKELGPPEIKYDWLCKFISGKIKNPGFDKVERLVAILMFIDSQEGRND